MIEELESPDSPVHAVRTSAPRKMKIPASGNSRLGQLLNSYTARWEDENLLLEILSSLPAATGLQTVLDLQEALDDFGNQYDEFVFSDEPSPAEIEAGFLASLGQRTYNFLVPLARAAAATKILPIGGRYDLALHADEPRDDTRFFWLVGAVRVHHPSVARRHALVIAAEVLGLLMSVGVAECRIRPRLNASAPPDLRISLSLQNEDSPFDSRLLSWRETADVLNTVILVPSDPTELEHAALKRLGNDDALLRQRVDLATRPFRTGGEDAKKIRRAAQYLRKAATTDDPGDSYLSLATCLEGVLIESDKDVSARVVDAVSLLLGRTHNERAALKEQARTLYNVRSRYIHEGTYTGAERHRLACITMARRVLASELRALRDAKQ